MVYHAIILALNEPALVPPSNMNRLASRKIVSWCLLPSVSAQVSVVAKRQGLNIPHVQ